MATSSKISSYLELPIFTTTILIDLQVYNYGKSQRKLKLLIKMLSTVNINGGDFIPDVISRSLDVGSDSASVTYVNGTTHL